MKSPLYLISTVLLTPACAMILFSCSETSDETGSANKKVSQFVDTVIQESVKLDTPVFDSVYLPDKNTIYPLKIIYISATEKMVYHNDEVEKV